MEFNKTNLAIASGFTGSILCFFKQVIMRLMHFGGIMHMNKGMCYGCSMSGWGIIIRPIIVFFIAAGAGWLLAFFYNKLGKK